MDKLLVEGVEVNMKFEYNGNLLEDERINLVASEIIAKYPQVSIEKAKEAAMLEGKISTVIKTVNDELNRLYNIMLVNSNNKNIVSLVYKDFLNILRTIDENDNNIYINLVNGINDYLQNYSDFPFLSDYQ